MEEDSVAPSSPKRRLDNAEEGSATKRMRIPYKHHHKLSFRSQTVHSREPALIDQETVDKLLIEAIKHVCEEQGIKQGLPNPFIESVALEAYRNAVEECSYIHHHPQPILTMAVLLKFCSFVRRTMQAARRTIPVATDFQAAIDALDVPLLSDQLPPYQMKPEINPPLLPTPPPEDVFHNNLILPPSLLGPELDGKSALKRFALNPAALPPLPSAHTYKDTAVFPQRETDSRKLRELATEEGKMGEQALRRLAGAVKVDAAHPVDAETKKQASAPIRPGRRRKKPDINEEAAFEEAMRDLLKDEPQGFELGPIVTSEKQYRMPDDTQTKKRAVAVDGNSSSAAQFSTKASQQLPAAMEGVETFEL